MVTNGESFSHCGHGYSYWPFWLSIPMMKVMFVIWSLLLSNLWDPALPNMSSRSLEAISGTPLYKQVLVLWEAPAGMGLEVRVYSYTSRQALARKYAYIHTTVVKVLKTIRFSHLINDSLHEQYISFQLCQPSNFRFQCVP